MALGEILEVKRVPQIRFDMYQITYIETEPHEDDQYGGLAVVVLVDAKDINSAIDRLKHVYTCHYGRFTSALQKPTN